MAVLSVPITKGKASMEIDTEKLPDAVYAEALLQGLKVLANRGMSKITKAELGDDETVKTEAMVKAAANVEDIMAGKIKFTGQKKAKGASGAAMTEARRLARNLVKDEMKRAGIKISHVEASEITKAANALLDADPALVEQAKANIEAREQVPVKDMIDIKSLIQESPELVAKANARKAKSKETLSAKQAGMVKAKAKGKGQSAAVN